MMTAMRFTFALVNLMIALVTGLLVFLPSAKAQSDLTRRLPPELSSPAYRQGTRFEESAVIDLIERIAQGEIEATPHDQDQAKAFMNSVETLAALKVRILHESGSYDHRDVQTEYLIEGLLHDDSDFFGCGLSETRLIENFHEFSGVCTDSDGDCVEITYKVDFYLNDQCSPAELHK